MLKFNSLIIFHLYSSGIKSNGYRYRLIIIQKEWIFCGICEYSMVLLALVKEVDRDEANII